MHDPLNGRGGPRLTPLLDIFIEQVHGPSQVRSDGKFHPSELHGFCPRNVVLSRIYHGVSQAPNARRQRLFDVGHALHKWYQDRYFGPMGTLFGVWRCSRCFHLVKGFMPKGSCPECQWTGRRGELTPALCKTTCVIKDTLGVHAGTRDPKKVAARFGCNVCREWGFWEYRELNVRHKIGGEELTGHVDGIIRFPDTKEYVLWDAKTANERGIKDLPNPADWKLEQISPGYVFQQQLYLGLVRALFPKFEITRSLLFFISKNDSKEFEFSIPHAPEVFEETLEQIRVVNTSWSKKGKLPPRLSCCTDNMCPRAVQCGTVEACFLDREYTVKELFRHRPKNQVEDWNEEISF